MYSLEASFFEKKKNRKSSWVIFFFSFFCVGCIKTLGQKPDEQTEKRRNGETEKRRNGETDRMNKPRLDISFKTEMNEKLCCARIISVCPLCEMNSLDYTIPFPLFSCGSQASL